jgi:hypothetical protein
VSRLHPDDFSVHVQVTFAGHEGAHMRFDGLMYMRWVQWQFDELGYYPDSPETVDEPCSCGLEIGQRRERNGRLHSAWSSDPCYLFHGNFAIKIPHYHLQEGR